MTHTVFQLSYEREYPDREDTELHIGVFSSRAEAESAIARLSEKTGFRDYPQGFQIHETKLNRSGWTEGFITVKHPSKDGKSDVDSEIPAWVSDPVVATVETKRPRKIAKRLVSMAETDGPKPSNLFMSGQRRPVVDRALGLHVWTRDGRRFIDAASGPVAVNLGYSNPAVLEAMKRQMDRTTFAYRLHFENEAAEELAHTLAERLPEGMDRLYFLSGGSEAVESCIKLARQWAVGTGQPRRWKVIGRMPSYHGGTYGSLSVTGDGLLTDTFSDQIRMMMTVPAPTAWRDRDNLSMEERGVRYADMLDEAIVEAGPEQVLAFIMEPVGGAATAALVGPDSYYARVREICDRHGILLIHDEVMSGAGRTGKFLGGDHWNCRPDILSLSKGIGSGYMPLGAIAATRRIVDPVVAMGGFQHGHTYAGNPLACAAGLAVLGEMDRLDLIANAASMGALLEGELRGLAKRFPFMADVRGKGLLLGVEMVGDPETLAPIDPAKKATQRLLDIAYRRGLIVYGRRVRGGRIADNVMVCPPLIVTREDIAEIIGILGDSLETLAAELALPVNG